MSTSVKLDEHAYELARELAEQRGQPLSATVSELVRAAAAKSTGTAETSHSREPFDVEQAGDKRIPVFQTASDAPTMTSEQVRRLLSDFP